MKHRCYFTVALAVAGFSSGCQQERAPEPRPIQQASARPPAAPLPIVEKPMDREALIIAVIHAASDASLGKIDEPAQRSLDGKPFSVRMRFGCDGASRQTGSRGWTFDEKRGVLSLKVESDITDETASVRALGRDAYEAVEGFWIGRPWVLAAGCPIREASLPEGPTPRPVSSSSAAPVDEQEQPARFLRIGLAQFFTQTDARTHRRDKRPYTANKVLAEGARPSPQGYDLVVSGRLRRLANGSVIACANRGPLLPPDCVISAQFDTVAIEEPTTGETIATWSSA